MTSSAPASIDALLSLVLEDQPYYDETGGGVTFSGGGCMLYPDFVAALAKKCKENGISVAVDTAGCVPFSYSDFNDGDELARIKVYCEEKHLPCKCLSYHAYGESKREALESMKKAMHNASLFFI